MSTKHTQGEWVHAKGGSVLDAGGRLVASAWHPEPLPDTQEERNPGESWLDASIRLRPEVERIEARMEEHARLIAAAPELLEALKDCRRALELANATGELAVVDAAIAKATGEQA